jgi:hypothetical protein
MKGQGSGFRKNQSNREWTQMNANQMGRTGKDPFLDFRFIRVHSRPCAVQLLSLNPER